MDDLDVLVVADAVVVVVGGAVARAGVALPLAVRGQPQVARLELPLVAVPGAGGEEDQGGTNKR